MLTWISLSEIVFVFVYSCLFILILDDKFHICMIYGMWINEWMNEWMNEWIKCWNDNSHLIVRINIYFVYPTATLCHCLSLFPTYFTWSPYEPYNLGWYVSVLILNVYFILKLGIYYIYYVNFLFVFFFMYIFCLIYVTWILTCSISFGLWPHVAGLKE